MKHLVLLISLMFVACTQATQEEVKVNTDMEQLEKLISLPSAPIKSMWSIVELSKNDTFGSNDWALVAILSFPIGTIEKLFTDEKIVGKGSFVPAMNWYPTEFTTQLKIEGNSQLSTNVNKYSAELFYSSPLLNGYILPIHGTNDIYLYLFTM